MTERSIAGEKCYVLYTTPRAEKQVEWRLRKEGRTAFLPLHLSPCLYHAITLQGVSHVVYYDGKPAVVRESEITAIQQFLEEARAKELNYHPEEEVLIACGHLKNISGKIKKID
jgi:transcription antitermination factor NusG